MKWFSSVYLYTSNLVHLFLMEIELINTLKYQTDTCACKLNLT